MFCSFETPRFCLLSSLVHVTVFRCASFSERFPTVSFVSTKLYLKWSISRPLGTFVKNLRACSWSPTSFDSLGQALKVKETKTFLNNLSFVLLTAAFSLHATPGLKLIPQCNSFWYLKKLQFGKFFGPLLLYGRTHLLISGVEVQNSVAFHLFCIYIRHVFRLLLTYKNAPQAWNVVSNPRRHWSQVRSTVRKFSMYPGPQFYSPDPKIFFLRFLSISTWSCFFWWYYVNLKPSVVFFFKLSQLIWWLPTRNTDFVATSRQWIRLISKIFFQNYGTLKSSSYVSFTFDMLGVFGLQ